MDCSVYYGGVAMTGNRNVTRSSSRGISNESPKQSHMAGCLIYCEKKKLYHVPNICVVNQEIANMVWKSFFFHPTFYGRKTCGGQISYPLPPKLLEFDTLQNSGSVFLASVFLDQGFFGSNLLSGYRFGHQFKSRLGYLTRNKTSLPPLQVFPLPRMRLKISVKYLFLTAYSRKSFYLHSMLSLQ